MKTKNRFSREAKKVNELKVLFIFPINKTTWPQSSNTIENILNVAEKVKRNVVVSKLS